MPFYTYCQIIFQGAQLKAAKTEVAFMWREHLEKQRRAQTSSAPMMTAVLAATGAYSRIHATHQRACENIFSAKVDVVRFV